MHGECLLENHVQCGQSGCFARNRHHPQTTITLRGRVWTGLSYNKPNMAKMQSSNVHPLPININQQLPLVPSGKRLQFANWKITILNIGKST